MRTLIATLLLLVSFHSMAADAGATLSFSNVDARLIDLDPSDGVTPALGGTSIESFSDMILSMGTELHGEIFGTLTPQTELRITFDAYYTAQTVDWAFSTVDLRWAMASYNDESTSGDEIHIRKYVEQELRRYDGHVTEYSGGPFQSVIIIRRTWSDADFQWGFATHGFATNGDPSWQWPSDPLPVPEPSSFVLVVAGLLVVMNKTQRRTTHS